MCTIPGDIYHVEVQWQGTYFLLILKHCKLTESVSYLAYGNDGYCKVDGESTKVFSANVAMGFYRKFIV